MSYIVSVFCLLHAVKMSIRDPPILPTNTINYVGNIKATLFDILWLRAGAIHAN